MSAYGPCRIVRFEGPVRPLGIIGEGPPLVLVHGDAFLVRRLAKERAASGKAPARLLFRSSSLWPLGNARGAGCLARRSESACWRLVPIIGLCSGPTSSHTILAAHGLARLAVEWAPLSLAGADRSGGARAWGSSSCVMSGGTRRLSRICRPTSIRRSCRYIGGAAYRPLPAEALRLYAEPWSNAAGQAASPADRPDGPAYTDEIEGRYGEIDCPTVDSLGRARRLDTHRARTRLAARIPNATFPGR